MQNPPPVQTSNSTPVPTSKSSTGLEENVAALLSYVFGWVSGLIFFLIEKDSRLVRFHAMQSLLFNVLVGIIFFVLWIVLFVFFMITSQVSGALTGILTIISTLVWVVLCIAVLI